MHPSRYLPPVAVFAITAACSVGAGDGVGVDVETDLSPQGKPKKDAGTDSGGGGTDSGGGGETDSGGGGGTDSGGVGGTFVDACLLPGSVTANFNPYGTI